MGNPYLQENRLQDVIAAITALGTYKFYKLDFSGWAERISGTAKGGIFWEKIFREHPEFFRINSDDGKASLVWRRQFPRNHNVDSDDQFDDPASAPADRISRRPLEPSELTALIGIAVSLHERALDQQQSSRWWISIATALLAFVGGLAGSLIG